MNYTLQEFARSELKQGLSKCTEGQQLIFKKMYAGGNLDLPITEVVDNMDKSKLDWAMQQVESTLAKARKGTT